MNDIDKGLRLAALTQMLQAYGAPVTEDRLRALGNLTKHVPQSVFAAACERAAIENDTGWPPGPGQIIKAALDLAPGEVNPGQTRSKPRWYLRARGERVRAEKPREIGPRSGESDAPFSLDQGVDTA